MSTFAISSHSGPLQSLQQRLKNLPKEQIRVAIEVIRENLISNDGKYPIKASIESPNENLSDTVEQIRNDIFALQDVAQVQLHLHQKGFESLSDFALNILEQELANQAQAKINPDHLQAKNSVLLLVTSQRDLPDPVPNVMQADSGAGELPQQIQSHFEKLKSQIETIMMRLEENPSRDSLNTTNALQEELKELQNTLDFRVQAWKRFETCLKQQPHLKLFSQDPVQRSKQYLDFAYQLNRAFGLLKEKGLEELFFAKDGGLYDLPETCLTGWHSRTQGLLTLAGLKKGNGTHLSTQAQTIARDLRRYLVSTVFLKRALELMGNKPEIIGGHLSNVHYQQASKQWGNIRWHLAYSTQELGPKELATHVINPYMNQAQAELGLKYSTRELMEVLKSSFHDLTTDEREGIIQGLVDNYKKACQQEPELLLDPLLIEQNLYQKLKETNTLADPEERLASLKKIKNELQERNIPVSFSLLSLQESLEVELKKLSLAWFNKASKELDKLDSRERAFYLIEIYKNLPEEKKSQEATSIIERIADSLNPDSQAAYLEQQKASLSKAIGVFEDLRLRFNGDLLAKKLATGKDLEPFGAILWGLAAKIFHNPEHLLDNKLQSILRWTGQTRAFEIEQILEKIEIDPSSYIKMPKQIRELPEVQAFVKENPWIKEGAPSFNEYQHYLNLSPLSLEQAPDWVRSCRPIVLAAARQNGLNLIYAASHFLSDPEVVLTAFKQNKAVIDPFTYGKFPHDILQLPDIQAFLKENPWIEAGAPSFTEYQHYLNLSPISLENAPFWARNCKEIVLAAVCQNGFNLKYASIRLLGEQEIVQAAFNQDKAVIDPSIYSKMPKQIRELPQIRAFLTENPWIEAGAPSFEEYQRYLNSPSISLAEAPNWARSCKEVVLASVLQNGLNLEYASTHLLEDREIALAAVNQNEKSYDFIRGTLQKDKDIVLAALKKEYWSNSLKFLISLSSELQKDREIMLLAIKQVPDLLLHASLDLQSDKSFILEVVSGVGLALAYANEKMKADRDVVLAAVSQNGDAWKHASDALQKDKEIILVAMETVPFIAFLCDPSVYKNDEEFRNQLFG